MNKIKNNDKLEKEEIINYLIQSSKESINLIKNKNLENLLKRNKNI